MLTNIAPKFHLEFWLVYEDDSSAITPRRGWCICEVGLVHHEQLATQQQDGAVGGLGRGNSDMDGTKANNVSNGAGGRVEKRTFVPSTGPSSPRSNNSKPSTPQPARFLRLRAKLRNDLNKMDPFPSPRWRYDRSPRLRLLSSRTYYIQRSTELVPVDNILRMQK